MTNEKNRNWKTTSLFCGAEWDKWAKGLDQKMEQQQRLIKDTEQPHHRENINNQNLEKYSRGSKVLQLKAWVWKCGSSRGWSKKQRKKERYKTTHHGERKKNQQKCFFSSKLEKYSRGIRGSSKIQRTDSDIEKKPSIISFFFWN